jgi:hypothetical protein
MLTFSAIFFYCMITRQLIVKKMPINSARNSLLRASFLSVSGLFWDGFVTDFVPVSGLFRACFGPVLGLLGPVSGLFQA